MSTGGRPDRRAKVLEFCGDETTTYVILSHRWINGTEVEYEDMVDLARMDVDERDEIRKRLGYKKILDICKQAKGDGYDWVWVDTCCIDKRSSAELSEAINSMYRWYENSMVCYAYLHDVSDPFFPTESDESRYPDSNGWPEWFSRGWTLQEMIAPRNVLFFNTDWQHIGDKRMLVNTLYRITRVPRPILKDGLSGNRPCIAQIMSWAANRTTTRVEDKAYSLMGLLDVNMPMLYGEGKKAFHRLQLEIIRTPNDQSIFAWGRHSKNVRTGSILADDPSLFEGCSRMELINPKEFIDVLRDSLYLSAEELPSINQDHFGVFPITNRGIHIWLFLRPHRDFDSVFEAWLPCRYGRWVPPVTINLALWNSNHYRYSSLLRYRTEQPLQFRQVYLRYQDTYHDVTFDIDDGGITEKGFTYCGGYPQNLVGNTFTLTAASPLCVRTYCNGQARFAVECGRYLGQDWVHIVNNPPSELLASDKDEMLVRGFKRAQSIANTPSRADPHDRIWVNYTCPLGSTWIVRTYRVVWERSKIGVRLEIFHNPGVYDGLGQWRNLVVEVGGLFVVRTYH